MGRLVIPSTFDTFARNMKVTEQAKTDLPVPRTKKSLCVSDDDEDPDDKMSVKSTTTMLPPGLFEYIVVDSVIIRYGS